MADKLAPRDKVGVDVSVVEGDPMATPAPTAGEANPEAVTDKRSVSDQGETVSIKEPDVNQTRVDKDATAMSELPAPDDVDFSEVEEYAGLATNFMKTLSNLNPFSKAATYSPIKSYIKKQTEDEETILEKHREVKKSAAPELTPEQKKEELDRFVELTDKNKYIVYDKDLKPNFRPRNDLSNGNIYNLKDIEDGDDIDAAIQAMAEHLQEPIQKARRGDKSGVLHDEVVRQLAKALVLDPARMREVLTRPDGTAAATEEIYAMAILYRQHAAKYYKAQAKAKAEGATQEDVDAWYEAMQTQAALLRKFMGYRAEWGRGGRALNMSKSDMDDDITMSDQDFINLALNGYDANTLLKMMPDGDTAQSATYNMMFVKGLSKLNKLASEWFIKSILSGVHTQAINGIGVASELGISVVDRYIAELGSKAWIKMGGAYHDDMIAVGETQALLQGEVLSMKQALATAWKVMKTAETYDGGKFIPDETQFQHENPILNGILKTADVVNGGFMTSRVMGGVDAFGKVMAEQGQYAALAYRKAYRDTQAMAKEGLNPDVANHFFQTKLEEYLEKPTPDMVEEARHYGKRATYQDKTYIGDKVGKFRDVPMFNFFIPFINTPLSSFIKNFLERVPVVGFMVPATTALIRNKPMTIGETQMSLSRQITGGAIISTMYMLAEDGQLTGSRPDWKTTQGRREYDVWMAQKRMEMSYLSDDEWQLQLKRIEQITYLAQVVADMRQLSIDKDYEYTQEETEAADRMTDYTNALVTSLMQNMEDKTFLQGLSMFFEGVDKGYGRFFEGVATGMAPMSGLRRNMTDMFFVDNVKVKDNLGDKMQANLLWLSKNLPNKLDIFGRPLSKDTRITPIKYGEMQAKIDPTAQAVTRKQQVVLDLMYEMSKSIHQVPFGVPNKMYNGVKLESKDYHDFTKLSRSDIIIEGKNFTDTIYDAITSSEFKGLDSIEMGDLEGMATSEIASRTKYNVLQQIVRSWDDGVMKVFLHGRGEADVRLPNGEEIVPNAELLRKMNKKSRVKLKKRGVNAKIGEE